MGGAAFGPDGAFPPGRRGVLEVMTESGTPLGFPDRIETDRLVLLKPRPGDAEAIFERYAQDCSVTQYLSWRPHTDIEETRDFLEGCLTRWERGSDFDWVITMRGKDTCIGMAALRIRDSRAELGYVLAWPFWGKGIMTEAVRALASLAFARPDISRVWAVCDVENAASARVLEKAGLVREGILHRWASHPNVSPEPRDCLCYAKGKDSYKCKVES